ncbi:5624_t:CDS:2, partial [Acaulospora colombiana]
AASGDIPMPQESSQQLLEDMRMKFEKDILELQEEIPVSAVMVLLVPDNGYIDMNNIASVPVEGHPCFPSWFEQLTEFNQNRWLSIMAAYDSTDAINLEPRKDHTVKRRPGKASHSKVRMKMKTNDLPLKIADFDIKHGMGASGWPGEPSWRNIALNRDKYWPQDTPQWWETGDPSKITIDSCYKMLNNMMDGVKGTIPEEEIIRYLQYNPELVNTKSGAKPSRTKNAVETVDIPEGNTENPTEEDNTESLTERKDGKGATGNQRSSEEMFGDRSSAKDQSAHTASHDSTSGTATCVQPSSSERNWWEEGAKHNSSTGETVLDRVTQSVEQSLLDGNSNNHGSPINTMHSSHEPEADQLRVTQEDRTESQVDVLASNEMNHDPKVEKGSLGRLTKKKRNESAKQGNAKSVTSRKRTVEGEDSVEPPMKRQKLGNNPNQPHDVNKQTGYPGSVEWGSSPSSSVLHIRSDVSLVSYEFINYIALCCLEQLLSNVAQAVRPQFDANKTPTKITKILDYKTTEGIAELQEEITISAVMVLLTQMIDVIMLFHLTVYPSLNSLMDEDTIRS